MRGVVGKCGVLELGFELDSRGTTVLRHLHREVPLVVQQALYFDEELPELPCVYTLSSGGPTVEGDRHSVSVELGPGAMAHISSGAATLIASMEEGEAQMRQSIVLDEGAYLEWLPRPLIPGSRSRYTSSTELVVAPSATLFYSEVVACGREHSGERFFYNSLELSTVLCRPSGEVVLREALRLIPSLRTPSEWGLEEGHNHFGTSLVVAPSEVTNLLYNQLRPSASGDPRVSVARLKESSGLLVRFTSSRSEPIVAATRALCSQVRRVVKGVPLPSEFPWR